MKKAIEISMTVFLVLIAIGGWVLIAVFADWSVGIEHKINLLRALLIASTVLVGFAGVSIIKIKRGWEILVKESGFSEKRIKNFRIFISLSAVTGFLTIMVVIFYFITYEISLIIAAWILFIVQLEFFILPLIFSRILVFR